MGYAGPVIFMRPGAVIMVAAPSFDVCFGVFLNERSIGIGYSLVLDRFSSGRVILLGGQCRLGVFRWLLSSPIQTYQPATWGLS